jgi:hypothetical protein
MWSKLKFIYWYLYDKIVPLPSDEALSTKLRDILERAGTDRDVPAAASCCIVTFDAGGSVCSPDIHDQPTCTVWAATFDRPGTGLIFPGSCPASSRKIVRK